MVLSFGLLFFFWTEKRQYSVQLSAAQAGVGSWLPAMRGQSKGKKMPLQAAAATHQPRTSGSPKPQPKATARVFGGWPLAPRQARRLYFLTFQPFPKNLFYEWTFKKTLINEPLETYFTFAPRSNAMLKSMASRELTPCHFVWARGPAFWRLLRSLALILGMVKWTMVAWTRSVSSCSCFMTVHLVVAAAVPNQWPGFISTKDSGAVTLDLIFPKV